VVLALSRVKHREALAALLNTRLSARTTSEWVERFDAVGLPAGPVQDIATALAHPQTQARGMIVATNHPKAGAIRSLGLPIRFSEEAGASARPAPLLGEHTGEILGELGYTEREIEALGREGAIRRPD
jgi:formyl-CoA transferase